MLLEAGKKMARWSVTLRVSEERRVHRLCYSGLNLAAKLVLLSSAALARESNAALDSRSKLPIHRLRMSSCYSPNLGLEGAPALSERTAFRVSGPVQPRYSDL
jgi:hypothetical protein